MRLLAFCKRGDTQARATHQANGRVGGYAQVCRLASSSIKPHGLVRYPLTPSLTTQEHLPPCKSSTPGIRNRRATKHLKDTTSPLVPSAH